MRRGTSLAVLALAAWAAPIQAQETPAAENLPQDRIMAVIGDHILLVSEWRDQTVVLAEQLGVQPGSPEFRELATETFQQLVSDLVIYAAAQRDTTVNVTDEEVLEAVDREIAGIRRRFPTEEEFQRQLAGSQWGSLAAYRTDLQERKRRELMGQTFIEMRRPTIQPVDVSEEEVRALWDKSQGQLGTSPTLIRFEEIPVAISPGSEARDAARTEAQRIKDEILAGRLDFSDAAAQFSDDESNRDEGGDLGWFGRGRMVAPFEDAAFNAQLGEVVGPIETGFGMHVIQVIDRREDENRARHVLIAYDFTQDDRDLARAEADSLRERILAGADVDSIQSVAMPGDSAAAAILEIPADRLPPAYVQGLEGLEPGQATVIETPTGYSVVIARGTAGGEPITYELVAPRIRQQLSQQKAEDAFVNQLRKQVYVDVRIQPEEVLGSG